MKSALSAAIYRQRGFTLSEMLVVFCIVGIMAGIAVPNINQLTGQMRAQEEIQTLAGAITELRLEAIRMRSSIRLTFTTQGYSWDIGDDGTTDGSYTLSQHLQWASLPGASILINGLGLARGIATERSISISSHGHTSTLTINRNGYVSI